MTQLPIGFIQAIRETPDDDLPRLVAADWLEEHGESERSEFIRVQCKLAAHLKVFEDAEKRPRRKKLGRPPNSERLPLIAKQLTVGETGECRRREVDLLHKNWHDWLSSTNPHYFATNRNGMKIGWLIKPQGEDARLIRTVFRRGFVEEVTCTADDWLAHGYAIVGATPVRLVRLTTLPRDYEAVVYNGKLMAWSGSRWPGIKFELPPDRNVIRVVRPSFREQFGDLDEVVRWS
jgi:uncharacterized protein (TIGR02996 family)